MAEDAVVSAESWGADDVMMVVPNATVVKPEWVTCEVYGADARVFRRPIAGRHVHCKGAGLAVKVIRLTRVLSRSSGET
eukprot:538849-Rhodomonas_salina.1